MSIEFRPTAVQSSDVILSICRDLFRPVKTCELSLLIQTSNAFRQSIGNDESL